MAGCPQTLNFRSEAVLSQCPARKGSARQEGSGSSGLFFGADLLLAKGVGFTALTLTLLGVGGELEDAWRGRLTRSCKDQFEFFSNEPSDFEPELVRKVHRTDFRKVDICLQGLFFSVPTL